VVGATERLCPPFPLQAEPRLVPTASAVAITIPITSAIIIAVTIAATLVIAVASTTIVTLVFRTIVPAAPATSTTIVIVGVVIGIVAAATTTTSAILSIVIFVRDVRLVVIDRAVPTTFQPVRADIVVAIRHARLAVVDRTIAATLEAVRADVVIRHRTGERGVDRSGLGSRALCRNRPGDNAGRCGKSQTFHWKFPIRLQFPTVRLRCGAGIILAAPTILVFSHQARVPPRMATRKHKFHVDSALATAMDNHRKIVSVEPPEIASAQGHRVFSDLHPAARRSLTHEVIKPKWVAGRGSSDQ